MYRRDVYGGFVQNIHHPFVLHQPSYPRGYPFVTHNTVMDQHLQKVSTNTIHRDKNHTSTKVPTSVSTARLRILVSFYELLYEKAEYHYQNNKNESLRLQALQLMFDIVRQLHTLLLQPATS